MSCGSECSPIHPRLRVVGLDKKTFTRLFCARNDWWTRPFSEQTVARFSKSRARTRLGDPDHDQHKTESDMFAHHVSSPLARTLARTWLLHSCSAHAFTRTRFLFSVLSLPPPPHPPEKEHNHLMRWHYLFILAWCGVRLFCQLFHFSYFFRGLPSELDTLKDIMFTFW